MQLHAALNQSCQCVTLDRAHLQSELARDPALQGLAGNLHLTHPHLFSDSMVFISTDSFQAIEESIACIERLVSTPQYAAHALRHAPDIARQHFGPKGVMMGYDFHVNAQSAATDGLPARPQLIEINTNAGGAMLSAALARSQLLCCQGPAALLDTAVPLAHLEDTWFDMFQNEWRLQRGDQPLLHVAIVDDTPDGQYLAPEFALFRHLFASRGLRASIVSPEALQWRDGLLWLKPAANPHDLSDPNRPTSPDHLVDAGVNCHDQPIDLVYNRLTDFDLSLPAHQSLRDAYLAQAVVVTPHPHAHALMAHKRNLVTLSDAALLTQWGVSPVDIDVLTQTVPPTSPVCTSDADRLWSARRHLFFKPVAGYGGKAAYRGDKLTKGAWRQVLDGDFVAQTVAPPGLRQVNVEGVTTEMKYDIRAYTYQGQIQLLTARTYQGQTTNFRTPGGGFAPVMVMPPLELTTEGAAQACAC